jgi:exonuclease VII small subunit
VIALLADGKAPLGDLVAAHQRAVELLAETQARLKQLQVRVDATADLMSK